MKKTLFFCLSYIIFAKFCFAGVSFIGELSREKIVEPGEKFEGIILLKNVGEKYAEVRIYQTDYLFFANGTSLYDEPGSVPRSNANWISFSPNRLTIPPREIAAVYYTGQVPKIPDLKGTYWSMMMVEPMAEASPEGMKDEKGKVKIGLQTILRYGFQIITHIGDTGLRKIQFLDKRLISQDGKKVLQISVENVGERMLSPLVWIELYNKDGIDIGRFESGRFRIYPGCSVKHNFELKDIPKGQYKVLVIVDNGEQYVIGAQYNLEVEE